jgi:hypothetical protein
VSQAHGLVSFILKKAAMKQAATRAAIAIGILFPLLAMSCSKSGLGSGGSGGAITSSGGAGGSATGGSGGSGAGGTASTPACHPVPPCPSGWYQYSDRSCGPPYNGTQSCQSNGDGLCYPLCQTTADCTDPRFPTCGGITVFGGSDVGSQKLVCRPVAGLARCSGGTGGASGTGGVVTGTGGTVAGTGGTIKGTGGAGGIRGSGGSSGTTTPDAGPQGCVVNGHTYAIGETFKADCNTCTCTASGGVACTTMACVYDARPDQSSGPDLGGGTCALSANLTFGHDGGNAIYWDVNRLTASGFTITRNYSGRAGRDGATTASCAPSLPACGSADVVSVGTINADLADPDVQGLWSLPQDPVPLFGTDPRPVDGTVYSIAIDDGHQVLVGGQCASPTMNSCRNIPAGLVRLTQDLQKLATAMLADPACKGL